MQSYDVIVGIGVGVITWGCSASLLHNSRIAPAKLSSFGYIVVDAVVAGDGQRRVVAGDGQRRPQQRN